MRLKFWERPAVDLNLRNNFDIPGFRRRPLIPFGRLNGEVALIATAIWTALTTTGFGITVAGVTVGITWGGAIVVAAVIGLEIWSGKESHVCLKACTRRLRPQV